LPLELEATVSDVRVIFTCMIAKRLHMHSVTQKVKIEGSAIKFGSKYAQKTDKTGVNGKTTEKA
jgi:hypothetical protein